MKIEVGQHIYGNFEKEVSPRKIGGFQTIGYTRSMLGETESDEIEKKLVYNFSEIEPIKIIFFSLSNNKYVLSRLIPLPDLDRFGRKGIYLAHSFIVSLGDFMQISCNPFLALKLLNPYFINSNMEALTVTNLQGANLNNLVLEATDDVIKVEDAEILKEVQIWDNEELKKLAYTALNYSKLKVERKSIALVGKPENIKSALSVALALIANQNKLNCSFDTYAYGCNPVSNYYWAFGYPQPPPTSQGFIIVDTVLRKVNLNSYSSDSCYEQWLFSNITQRNYSEILSHKELAAEFHKLLSGEQYDGILIKSASTTFIREFFEINWSTVIKAINATLKNNLGANLALKVQDQAFSHCQNLDPLHLLAVLTNGFNLQMLAEDLYKVYKSSRLSESELNELGTYLKKVKHDLLSIRYYYWKKNSVELLKLLDGLDERTYREIIEQLMKEDYWSLSSLMSPSRSELLVEVFLDMAKRDTHQITQVPRMVRALVMTHQEAQLKTLIPLLTHLNLAQLKEIEEEERKSSKVISKDFYQLAKKAKVSKETEEKSKRSVSGIFSKVFKKRE